jgi:hypothetical protein
VGAVSRIRAMRIGELRSWRCAQLAQEKNRCRDSVSGADACSGDSTTENQPAEAYTGRGKSGSAQSLVAQGTSGQHTTAPEAETTRPYKRNPGGAIDSHKNQRTGQKPEEGRAGGAQREIQRKILAGALCYEREPLAAERWASSARKNRTRRKRPKTGEPAGEREIWPAAKKTESLKMETCRSENATSSRWEFTSSDTDARRNSELAKIKKSK